jgi:protein arginine kinase activator
MECHVCKQREATVYLTQIVDDDVRSLDLCEACAKQKGVSDPMGFSLANIFKAGVGEEPAKEPAPRPPAAEVKCPQCGLGHADFKKTGRLGCSDCYEAFGEVLDAMLKGMHKGIRHTGKVPGLGMPASKDAVGVSAGTEAAKAVAPADGPDADIERLSSELVAAVEREDFEKAAELRDILRAARAAAKTTLSSKGTEA